MLDIEVNGKNIMSIKDNGTTDIQDDEVVKEIKESLGILPSDIKIKDKE